MKTGIVVSNFDPACKNRCKIRVNGMHTKKVKGKYIIIDDDLPWALPAPNNNEAISIPSIGERVYVDVIDGYNFFYYGPVESSAAVKKLAHDNAEDEENLKILAFSETFDKDGTKNYVKIYYLPEKGLTIECQGNLISMPKYESMEIKTKNGAGISIDTGTGDITLHSDTKVTIDCNDINLSENAEEKLILGSKLMEKFNTHTHFVPGGTSTPPIEQLVPEDFSNKVKIG